MYGGGVTGARYTYTTGIAVGDSEGWKVQERIQEALKPEYRAAAAQRRPILPLWQIYVHRRQLQWRESGGCGNEKVFLMSSRRWYRQSVCTTHY